MRSAGSIGGTSRPLALNRPQFSIPPPPSPGVSRENHPPEKIFMNVLYPSSCPAYSRPFDPTIIGNHWWPSSWVVTPYRPRPPERSPQNTIIGYSIPPTGPATLIAVG